MNIYREMNIFIAPDSVSNLRIIFNVILEQLGRPGSGRAKKRPGAGPSLSESGTLVVGGLLNTRRGWTG